MSFKKKIVKPQKNAKPKIIPTKRSFRQEARMSYYDNTRLNQRLIDEKGTEKFVDSMFQYRNAQTTYDVPGIDDSIPEGFVIEIKTTKVEELIDELAGKLARDQTSTMAIDLGIVQYEKNILPLVNEYYDLFYDVAFEYLRKDINDNGFIEADALQWLSPEQKAEYERILDIETNKAIENHLNDFPEDKSFLTKENVLKFAEENIELTTELPIKDLITLEETRNIVQERVFPVLVNNNRQYFADLANKRDYRHDKMFNSFMRRIAERRSRTDGSIKETKERLLLEIGQDEEKLKELLAKNQIKYNIEIKMTDETQKNELYDKKSWEDWATKLIETYGNGSSFEFPQVVTKLYLDHYANADISRYELLQTDPMDWFKDNLSKEERRQMFKKYYDENFGQIEGLEIGSLNAEVDLAEKKVSIGTGRVNAKYRDQGFYPYIRREMVNYADELGYTLITHAQPFDIPESQKAERLKQLTRHYASYGAKDKVKVYRREGENTIIRKPHE